MAPYNIIVTDVTCYGSTKYCVAGWDVRRNQMIRPEPPTANAAAESSRFWDAGFAGSETTFSVGNIVSFEAAPPPPNFPFPHATEDRIVDTGRPMRITRAVNLAQIAAIVAAGVSPTLDAAFDGALVRPTSSKPCVPKGQHARSLGAVEIMQNQIKFYENTYDPKKPRLYGLLTIGASHYDLSVTADAARTRWKNSGLAALQADIKASRRLHVRLGLSRPWGTKPEQCYPQINGVYCL
jgi:putative nucleic acid modification protein with dual OB domain